MTERHAPGGMPAIVLVRRGLVALTVVGILSTAFELASERHWNDVVQLIPWLALAVLTVATALFLLLDGGGSAVVRVLALVVLAASVYGVLEHVLANFQAGELDQRFADSWESLPLLEKGWYAITRTVGPAPTLAPGVLGQTALLLFLATLCTAPRVRTPAT